MQYSRRGFLKFAGVALASQQLAAAYPLLKAQSEAAEQQGRTLLPLPIYPYPNTSAQAKEILWPDSIVTIQDVYDGWYRVKGGYVERHGLQPMQAALPGIQPLDEAFWSGFGGAAAAVRQWAAVDAPLVTRIGHGGVARVIDRLPADISGWEWYGLAGSSGDLLGWTLAAHWQPVMIGRPAAGQNTLEVDIRQHRITAWQGETAVLRALYATGDDIQAGRYSITGRHPGGVQIYLPGATQAYHGVPWMLTFGQRFKLGGVYWHNRFGSPSPGMTVQVIPALAQWLYHWLGDDARIEIH